ncbi:MAG: TetR family transcriptional regulator [Phenylobacterium sp.]|nr:TetR family transcriptional regulator [Phenylobacterium sp.]
MKQSSESEGRATRGLKRARVLGEAAKSLNHQGVSQTSLADIARRVGISRAALYYYYFDDQQDLVFQCYRQSCELMAQRLQQAKDGGGDALAVIDAFVDGMLDEEDTEFAALSEMAYLRADQRRTILGLYDSILDDVAGLLRDGAARRELRPCDGRIVGQAIIGLISWIPLARRWRTRESLRDADMVDATKDLLRHGVAADRTAPGHYRPFDLTPPGVPVTRIFDADTMAAARRESLLAAASWIFNLKGVDATSLEEIALLRGVTKKVIYHNVGDKETLIAECYRRSFQIYESLQARQRAYEGSRVEAICAQFHALAEASFREDIAPLAPLAGLESLAQGPLEEIHASAGRIMENSLANLAQGEAEGSVRPMNGRAVMSMLPGVFEWLPKWFDLFGDEQRARAPAELAELVRVGLRPI